MTATLRVAPGKGILQKKNLFWRWGLKPSVGLWAGHWILREQLTSFCPRRKSTSTNRFPFDIFKFRTFENHHLPSQRMRASSYHHQLTPSTKHCNEPVRRLKVIYHRCQPVLLPSPGRTHLKMMQTTIRCLCCGCCCGLLFSKPAHHLQDIFVLLSHCIDSLIQAFGLCLKLKKHIYIYLHVYVLSFETSLANIKFIRESLLAKCQEVPSCQST